MNSIEEIKIIPVIRTVSQIGCGTDDDPFREAIQYWDVDGRLLFTIDAMKEFHTTYSHSPL